MRHSTSYDCRSMDVSIFYFVLLKKQQHIFAFLLQTFKNSCLRREMGKGGGVGTNNYTSKKKHYLNMFIFWPFLYASFKLFQFLTFWHVEDNRKLYFNIFEFSNFVIWKLVSPQYQSKHKPSKTAGKNFLTLMIMIALLRSFIWIKFTQNLGKHPQMNYLFLLFLLSQVFELTR